MEIQRSYDQHPADRDFGPTILIVDDEKLYRTRLELLCQGGLAVPTLRLLEASSVSDALRILASTEVHVVLLDKHLGADDSSSDQNGIEAIPRFLQMQPQLQILVVTGSGDTQDAARAMSLGALWFLPKETPDDLIFLQIKKAVEVAGLVSQRLRDEATREKHRIKLDLAGNSLAIKRLKASLRAVSETNRPVLFLGENGCGKSTAAKMVHEYRKEFLKQPRRSFFSVNMGAVSATLAERELFGNEKGAYTGADEARPGFFELANNGTLFLDEIGEAPLDLQVKLLKVIEEGEFVRIGGSQVRQTSFKLICATNRDIEAMVAAREFREDLFMRISTLVVPIPSLAERRQDIPDVVRSLLPKCCADNNVHVSFEDLPADFVDYLVSTPLRGNIRGIEHQLSRLLVYSIKDKRGRPRLESWRDIPGMQARRNTPIANRSALTLKEMMSRPFDVVGPDFPGLSIFMTGISDRVLDDALTKHRLLADAAAALKVSITKVSLDRKRMRQQLSGMPTTVSGATAQYGPAAGGATRL